MPSNTAAWLVAAKATPLEVKPAAYTSPGDNEIVIKNVAVGVEQIDRNIQAFAMFPFDYPTILGQDVAGEVFEVGSSVSRFRKGDRVIGHATGMLTKKNCDNAFQQYTVVPTNMASPIPSTMSFESAVVIPLGLSTAACGLYQKEYLNLEHPSLSPQPTGKALLIWGGATSVGSNAIQLAVASGYEVITTASPKNFDYVKKLGASEAFDYHSETIVSELVHALRGKTIAGALDCIGLGGVVQTVIEVVGKCNGEKFVSTVKPMPKDSPDNGVKGKHIFGLTLKDNEVSKVIYEDFLPKALAEGTFVAAPEPEVFGKGLESLQAAFEANKKGVSAKKLVITL